MAQYHLAECYNKGYGVNKDHKKEVEWLIKAAKQGHIGSIFNLAVCYEIGSGIEKDQKHAVKLYLEAANQGDAWAQHNLARCYANGEGVRKNYKKAFEWFTKAAEQGHKDAQIILIDQFADNLLKDISGQPIVEEPLSQQLDMDVFKEFDENKDFNDFPF